MALKPSKSCVWMPSELQPSINFSPQAVFLNNEQVDGERHGLMEQIKLMSVIEHWTNIGRVHRWAFPAWFTCLTEFSARVSGS